MSKKIHFKVEDAKDAWGGFIGDQFTLPANRTVKCTVRFKDRQWYKGWVDVRDLECNAFGGKDGTTRRTMNYLRLVGNTPFSMTVVDDGQVRDQSDTVSQFVFDERAGVMSAEREFVKVTGGPAEGAVKKLDRWIKDGSTIISSPQEVASLLKASKELALLNRWKIGPQTKNVLKDLDAMQDKLCSGGECQPVLFLTVAEAKQVPTKIVPLACKENDPKKGCETVSIQFQSTKDWSCFMPGLFARVTPKEVAEETFGTHGCVTPPDS